MLKIAVCDDEPAQREYLASLVSRWADQKDTPVQISLFIHAEAFLFAYEDQKDFDILLLDIQMKEINGITLAETVRQEDESMQIIFITAFADYMPYGYEVSALHYLIKPVDEKRLFAVLDKAAKRRRHREAPLLFSTGEGQVKLLSSEIYYVEAFAHDCFIVMKKRKIQVGLAIGEMEARLGDAFVRCHRSYLVHLEHIRNITKNVVLLDNGDNVPVSRRLLRQVNRAFLRYYHPDVLAVEDTDE